MAKKKKSNKSSSKSSSKKNSKNSTKKYETTDGKKFSDKSAATTHQKNLNAKKTSTKTKTKTSSKTIPAVNYTYDSKKETVEQYKARVAKELAATKTKEETSEETKTEEEKKDTTPEGAYDEKELRESENFKKLDEDRKAAVLAVFQAIAANDTEKASKIVAAFEASTAISDPFFKQELRLAKDAIERGFVAIDQEEQYKVKQLQRNLADVQQDITTKRDQLSFEEQSALKDIERQYTNTLKDTRQNLASTGKTFSSERDLTEQMIEESTGQMRESTARQFGLQNLELQRTGERTARDTQTELERLSELTKQNRLDFLRTGESRIGSQNIGGIYKGGLKPLGDIVGDIPQRQFEDVLSGTQNLIF